MNRYLILAIALGASLPAGAQTGMARPVQPHAVMQVQRDTQLEQAAFARARRLASVLPPQARVRLDPAVRAVLGQLASGAGQADPQPLVRQEVRRRFPQASGGQADLLDFYVLAEVAQSLTAKDGLKGRLDGMNEMSEMTSLRLQMTMDRRSKFISTLSNMMKKISSTQDTLVQNIK